MGHSMTVPCGSSSAEPAPCGVPCRSWRQCPVQGCGFEVSRCEAHGGDARAVTMMLEHVSEHMKEPPITRGPFDFAAFADAKAKWAAATFGPQSFKGLRKHLEKELDELEADPGDLVEWIDLILLALDGAMRVGAKATGADVVNALIEKMAANRVRTWPDWRTLSPDDPREHVRGGQ